MIKIQLWKQVLHIFRKPILGAMENKKKKSSNNGLQFSGSRSQWNFHQYLKQQSHNFSGNSSKNSNNFSSFKNFEKPSSDWPICQIHDKVGHIAASCFYLCDALQEKSSFSWFSPTKINVIKGDIDSNTANFDAWLLVFRYAVYLVYSLC